MVNNTKLLLALYVTYGILRIGSIDLNEKTFIVAIVDRVTEIF